MRLVSAMSRLLLLAGGAGFGCSLLVSSGLDDVRCTEPGAVGAPDCPNVHVCREGRCVPCNGDCDVSPCVGGNCGGQFGMTGGTLVLEPEFTGGTPIAGSAVTAGGPPEGSAATAGSPTAGGPPEGSAATAGSPTAGGTSTAGSPTAGATSPTDVPPYEVECEQDSDCAAGFCEPDLRRCSKGCCRSEDCPGGVCRYSTMGVSRCVSLAEAEETTMGDGPVGTACQNNADCRSARCSSGVCLDTCCDDADCGGDLPRCHSSAWSPGMACSACMPAVCTVGCCSSTDCDVGVCSHVQTGNDYERACLRVQAGDSGLGEPCSTDGDCLSYDCFDPTTVAGGSGTPYCSDVCCVDEDCGQGFVCAPRVDAERYVLRCRKT